jgi:hypothetical protein
MKSTFSDIRGFYSSTKTCHNIPYGQCLMLLCPLGQVSSICMLTSFHSLKQRLLFQTSEWAKIEE